MTPPFPTASPNGSRRWLCVAYAFPPINRSGTHRTLGFVRELAPWGWNATVLTVDPADEPIDEDLLHDVPPSTHMVRTRWIDLLNSIGKTPRRKSNEAVLPDAAADHVDSNRACSSTSSPRNSSIERAPHRIGTSPERGSGSPLSYRRFFSQLLALPDSRIGWLLPALCAGWRAVRRDNVEVIYSTSPYMTAHLIALLLSRLLNLPWVADFRDPWRGHPFQRVWHPWLEPIDAKLERWVMAGAAQIICCTPTMTDQLRRRFPRHTAKMSTILNAFDGNRFTRLAPRRTTSDDVFTILHAGQFYGSRSPLSLFHAMSLAAERVPRIRQSMKLQLLGPDTYDGAPLREWAARRGVENMVVVEGRKPHAETMNRLAGGDALLLAAASGDGAALQIPNKLFEYLALKRPILALCSPDNPLIHILREAAAPFVTCQLDDPTAIAEALLELPRLSREIPGDAWSGVEQFERSHRARQLAAVLDRVTVSKPSLIRLLKSASCPASRVAKGEETGESRRPFHSSTVVRR